jgi:hypothetical protein
LPQTPRDTVERAIRDAFAGVKLGEGISLRRAEAADVDPMMTARELQPLLLSEITDDWAAVPATDLDRDAIAYLDARGLRYYLPALMIRLLDAYEPTQMWCIGTIFALDQRQRHPPGFLELLSPSQRRAIATYVRTLPTLVELGDGDAARIRRAFRDVWSRELEPDP